MNKAGNFDVPKKSSLWKGRSVLLVLTLLTLASWWLAVDRLDAIRSVQLQNSHDRKQRLLVLKDQKKALAETSDFRRTATPASAATSRTPLLQVTRLHTLGTLSDLFEQGVLRLPLGTNGVYNRFGPMTKLPPTGIDPQGIIAPGFGEVFGLDSEEMALLQQQVSSIKARVDAAILANTRVTRIGPEGYALEVDPIPDADRLRGEFLSAFHDMLGDEKFRAFSLLNGEITDSSGATRGGPGTYFDGFGSVRKRWVVTNDGAKTRYESESFGPDGKLLGRESTTGVPGRRLMEYLLGPSFTKAPSE